MKEAESSIISKPNLILWHNQLSVKRKGQSSYYHGELKCETGNFVGRSEIDPELTIGKSRGLRRVSFSSSGAIATTWSWFFALLSIRWRADEKPWTRDEEQTSERDEDIFVGDRNPRTSSEGEGSNLAEQSDAMAADVVVYFPPTKNYRDNFLKANDAFAFW